MAQYTVTAFRWSGAGYNALYNTSYSAVIDDDDANFKSFLTSIKSFVITFEEFELDNCRTLTSFSDTLVSCVSFLKWVVLQCQLTV